ncbi:MAG TPA: hypothetical protein PK733_12660, partial [Clostridiales bacterium]|nr:hypothetical protein [Clostridiales bacterium]
QGDGKLTLLVGNEGWNYSFISPLNLERILYRNFSLQGQPRDNQPCLKEVFKNCGIDKYSNIGVIGQKYFESDHIKGCEHEAGYFTDVPSYIIDILVQIVDRNRITNFTHAMTNLSDGLRITVKGAKEIAYYEYVTNKVSNCVINMLEGLEPGISELEASRKAGYDASPINMFPLVNFGEKHAFLCLRSPNHNKLKEGNLVTICYGIRGGLVARSGLAVKDKSGISNSLGNIIEEFYMPYFRAVITWYESVKIGKNCGEVYNKVMDILGGEKDFGVSLNPGHNISSDEWTNSPFYKDSPHKILNGYYLQCDIIASLQNPVRLAMLEDGVIFADEKLREELKSQYPDVYNRIQKRREFMIEVIGINLSDDVLPLSNAQAICHPFLLDTNKIFTIDKLMK